MVTRIIYTLLIASLLFHYAASQDLSKLSLRGNYTELDSISVVESYLEARSAVQQMHEEMRSIWEVSGEGFGSKKSERESRWNASSQFQKWLGKPNKIRLAKRRITAIQRKFTKKMTLQVVKANKGKCEGWISAWTLPFGKVKVWLCEDYFVYRTHLQHKILIHELGHEAGILFHRRIHGCRSARKAALSANNRAKRSTENYAWLAVSYLSVSCPE